MRAQTKTFRKRAGACFPEGISAFVDRICETLRMCRLERCFGLSSEDRPQPHARRVERPPLPRDASVFHRARGRRWLRRPSTLTAAAYGPGAGYNWALAKANTLHVIPSIGRPSRAC